MTPDEYCENKAAKSGSSFYYSFRFLPKEKRKAITALYAFCREVDDAVDEISDAAIAEQKLDWWKQEIDRTFSGNPEHPVGKALLPALSQYSLNQEYFHEIIDGMHMDLHYNRYPDFKQLQLYCYRVASVVGLLASEIFGYTNRRTLDYAHNLGMAFQLTNIIRDVYEDALRGRIYLPEDEMNKHGITLQDLLERNSTEAFKALMSEQVARAKHFYTQAFDALPDEDRFAQRSGIIMAEIYRTILDEIEKDGFRVLEHRIQLTPLRKLWIAWRAARREKQRYKISHASA